MAPGGGDTVVEEVQSDFTRLDDSDTDSELSLDDRDTREKNKRLKVKYIASIKNICGDEETADKILKVSIIGNYGVGKSSLINTMAAALSHERWTEHAYTGKYGYEGKPMSVFVETFPKCCKKKEEEYKDIALPTLIDIAGFPDEDNEKWRELLRIIFYGRLQEGESLTNAQEYCDKYGIEGLKQKYSSMVESLKIDRVIFVGAADQPVPKNLIKCVMDAARPMGREEDQGKRTIPVYGVLTHADKIDDNEETHQRGKATERDFVSALGLDGARHRFLRCRNYCDDVDQGKRTETCFPEIDVPVLKFMREVFNPEQRIHHDDEGFNAKPETVTPMPGARPFGTLQQSLPAPGPAPPPRGSLVVTLIVIAIEAVFVAILLHWFLAPTTLDRGELSSTCVRYIARKDQLGGYDFKAFTDLCQNIDHLFQKSLIVPFIFFVSLRVGTLFLLRYLPRILTE